MVVFNGCRSAVNVLIKSFETASASFSNCAQFLSDGARRSKTLRLQRHGWDQGTRRALMERPSCSNTVPIPCLYIPCYTVHWNYQFFGWSIVSQACRFRKILV